MSWIWQYFLGYDTKAQVTKTKLDKWQYVFKTCLSKDTFNRVYSNLKQFIQVASLGDGNTFLKCYKHIFNPVVGHEHMHICSNRIVRKN